MDPVSPIGVDPGTFAPAIGEYTSQLTPEALMTYLGTRLEGIDEQVKSIFERQEGIERASKAMRALNAKLESAKGMQASEVDFAEMNALAAEIAEFDPELGAQIQESLELGYDEETGVMSTDSIDAAISLNDGILDDLSAEGQLTMIRLQSLMSQRQTAVQLATNLVSSLSDSTNAVVANVK